MDIRLRLLLCLSVCLSILMGAGQVWAVPGPDSVAVIANKNIPESIALAQAYMKAREVPANQFCSLDLPTTEDITFADYESKLLKPFEACLTKSGVTSRIEAVLLIRGVPLRVTLPEGRGSLAAVLGMWKSTITPSNKAVVGLPVGYKSNLFAAGWSNAFRAGPFRPGWSATRTFRYTLTGQTTNGSYTHRPLLVTMLHGRSYQDAALLFKSAMDAERLGAAKGQFLFMEGRDSARGVLDREYDGLITQLKQRGFTDAVREKFQTDLAGRKLAMFITGTATLGKAIEDNTYLPGSLTDNLTSFGAAPQNFRATGQSQVSIARWVAKGAAGAHGTTDEPLNNVFPSRQLILDYVDGSTLAEAYHRQMPYVYWRNLVLGDPMAAPYAQRPTVKITNAASGATIAGARKVTVTATDPGKRGIASITLYVNGKSIATSKTSPLEACVIFPNQPDVHVLAVAQAGPATGTDRRKFQPKGWQSIQVKGAAGGPKDCNTTEPTTEVTGEVTTEATQQETVSTEALADTAGTNDAGSLSDTSTPSEQVAPDTTPDTSTTPDAATTPDPGQSPDPTPMSEDTPEPTSQDQPDKDTNGPGPTGGCGCHAGASMPWSMLWSLVLLGLLGWRRKSIC